MEVLLIDAFAERPDICSWQVGSGLFIARRPSGGVAGQIQSMSLCTAGAYGGAAVSGQMAFIPCADGLREIRLDTDSSLVSGWHAPQQVAGSPIIGGNTVYSLDAGGGTLYALDAATGAVRATISVGTTTRFATPTLFQNSIFVGTEAGIVAVGMG